MANLTFRAAARGLSTESLTEWLSNHRACLAAGVNVGQIQRDKAQAFALELATR